MERERKKPIETEGILTLLIFRLERQHFAIDIKDIREITLILDVKSLPREYPTIKGIIDLRGSIVPVIDIRERFNLQPFVPTKKSRILIVSVEKKIAGLIVDEAMDVVNIPKNEVRVPPGLLREEAGEYIAGIFKKDSDIIFIIEVAKLLGKREKIDIERIISEVEGGKDIKNGG